MYEDSEDEGAADELWAWGNILSDIAQHVANGLSQSHGYDFDESVALLSRYFISAMKERAPCNPPSKPQGLFVENSINMNSRSFLCVNQNSLRARLWQFSNKMRLEYQSLSYAVSMVLAQLRSTSGAQNMAAWTLRS